VYGNPWFSVQAVACTEIMGNTPVEIHVKKVRFKSVGKLGIVDFKYDRATGRYTESTPEASQHWQN
jgi:hypothetical protein